MNPKEPCQCDGSGFCNRYLKEVTDMEQGLCEGREDYREAFYKLSLDRINLKKERTKEANRVSSNNDSSSVAAIHLCSGLFDFLRSKFFLKIPIEKNKKVVIKGLERSGTGFVSELLETNLLSTEVDQQTKHNPTSDVDNPIVLCVKNPYSWWLSFRDYGHTLRYVENARAYDNPQDCIALWNSFYNTLIKSKHKTLILRYEDVLRDEEKEIERVSNFLGVRHTKINYKIKSYINNYANRGTVLPGTFDRQDYFLSKIYLDSMRDEDIISIYNSLDKKLLKKLGYTKEP